jgi:hypothetical protein
MEFDQLKEMWKKLPAEKLLHATPEQEKSTSLFDDLRSIEKKNRRSKWIVFILLSLTIIFIALIIFNYQFQYPATYIGICMMYLAMVIVIVFSFLNTVNLNSGFASESSMAFLQHTKKVLTLRKQFILYFMPWYAVLICGGLILYSIEVLAPASATFKMIYYAIVITWCAGATAIGVRNKMKRYRRNVGPALEKIESLLQQLQSEK